MQKVLVLKNDVEMAQFQSNSPRYIPLSEELWKALVKLPSVYDYAAYRQLLERFGTHYLSEGSLGGSFKVVAKIDEETEQYMSEDSSTSINFLREKQIFTTKNQHRFSPMFNCFVFTIFKGQKEVNTMNATGPSAGFCSSPSLTLNAEVVTTMQNYQLVQFLV